MPRPRSLAVAVLAIALLAGCAPRDRRPGLWLSGEPAPGPVADWSFTDEVPEIFVETRTWYGVPHSVTTVCAAEGGALYVPSLYFEEGDFPDARFWNRNAVRDPRVRLQIGGRLYERRAVVVDDEAERAVALSAFARKYPFWHDLAGKPEAERPRAYFFRMDPPEGV